MATHSSILAWEILWTEEPGGLQSLRSKTSWTQLKQLNDNNNICFLRFPASDTMNFNFQMTQHFWTVSTKVYMCVFILHI